MIKIAICDDEIFICKKLNQKIIEQSETFQETFQIVFFTSAVELLKSSSDYDILLLDIQMPEVNGIDLAKNLRKSGNQCAIIFITILKENVFDAFEVEAIDYICKPIDDLRLKNALSRAIKHIKRKRKACLFIQTMNWCKSVPFHTIYYCEIINRKIYLHTQNGIVEYYGKLKEVEKQLDYRFIKCHRSYLINLDFLSEYTNGQIILENGEQIPVSRSHQQTFIKLLLQYMKKRED